MVRARDPWEGFPRGYCWHTHCMAANIIALAGNKMDSLERTDINGTFEYLQRHTVGTDRWLLSRSEDRALRPYIGDDGNGARRQDCGGWRRASASDADVEEYRKRLAEGRGQPEGCGAHPNLCDEYWAVGRGWQGAWRVLPRYSSGNVDGAGQRADFARDAGGDRGRCLRGITAIVYGFKVRGQTRQSPFLDRAQDFPEVRFNSLDIGFAVSIIHQSEFLVLEGSGFLNDDGRRWGEFMSVLELCDREIAAVPLEATIADAINKMLDHHVGAVAVVDSEYRVAGIFTERDVLRKMALSHAEPRVTPVRELMTTPVEMATQRTGAG